MLFRPTANRRQPIAFTLVEMLIAMAITLVMMGAVVTLFANVSGSIRNRRATVEMSNQMRYVRNVLQQDLIGATCPGLTWQRPESNHGYIEIIEGYQTDQNPTPLLRDIDGNGTYDYDPSNPNDPDNEVKLDVGLSPLPRNNIGLDANNDGKITVQEREAHHQNAGSLVLSGLGDFDDILMLTVRNEHEPFIGRMPANVRPNATSAISFPDWAVQTVESPLAEVVWFAIENPPEDERANNFFGEPGMRTIYRRTLLIAPWINPYRFVNANGTVTDTFQHDGATFKAEPGLVRILRADITLPQAIAAIIAFQDRYDLSVRLEWDHSLGDEGRWKIMANTLGDLTKRENRFGHYGYRPNNSGGQRFFPYPAASMGSGYTGTPNVKFVTDPEMATPSQEARATANLQDHRGGKLTGLVGSYTPDPANYDSPTNNRRYQVRPFAYIEDAPTGIPATANAMLNHVVQNGIVGQVVRVVHGPVPLWGDRRGEDVMLTGALAFDLRVFDPGAPLFGYVVNINSQSNVEAVLDPSDAGWQTAYTHGNNMGGGAIGTGSSLYPYMGQGAFVELGYGYDNRWDRAPNNGTFAQPKYANAFASSSPPWFFDFQELPDVFGNLLGPGFAVYDTWSFHYENNGVNDDADFNAVGQEVVDEGTNGFDDPIHNGADNLKRAGDQPNETPILGVDDTGERETKPPYDRPLRGIQVLMRAYELDSRAIRQVRVNQHFMPE
jgi:type II secretory pathway pseudopilin PulG